MDSGLTVSELQRFAAQQRRDSMFKDGILADELRKQPAGDFCSWGGLNPWVAGVCPTCRYYSDCKHFMPGAV